MVWYPLGKVEIKSWALASNLQDFHKQADSNIISRLNTIAPVSGPGKVESNFGNTNPDN